ncbi:DUF4253 domain-containing protein [Porticoccus sp. W117]|uniref:DUF4253 domain-containing protein n=1 Tax=Porticoccus sp. W117 TaxID=3054777 RepID=UPI0025923D33|nr:DUF4253 domain-containing protein [Porticoccus sp. W117]
MKFSVLALAGLLLFGFGYDFSEEDQILLASNNIEANALGSISAIKGVEQLHTYDDDYNQVKAKGVLLKVKPNSGWNVVKTLRKNLSDSPYQAYFYDNNFGYGDDEVAVVPTKDSIQYLKTVKTNGLNYDLTADDVLKKYIEWNDRFDLRLLGAGMDWLQADVTKDGIDWRQFAKEVYEFCPDVVDQGTGTVEALESEMRKSKTLYLWWD